jgi:hypothetical protein
MVNARKMIWGSVLLSLVLFIPASAISSDDKDRWEMAAEKAMSIQPFLLYVDVAFAPNDSMDYWVVPMKGKTDDEIFSNIIKSTQSAVLSYAGICRDMPEVADMHLTIGNSPTNALATAHCQRYWVNRLQWVGNNPNSDEFIALSDKVWATLKINN